jgi:steroid delta-isomerase-like uncharacterized protein
MKIMITAANQKQIINDFIDVVWHQHDFSNLEQFLHKNAVAHNPLGEKRGIESIKNYIQSFIQGLPDLRISVIDTVAENNKVAMRWKMRGTNSGSFFNFPPTHNEITYEGITLFHLEDNKIQEYWVESDFYQLLIQLNAIPQALQPK